MVEESPVNEPRPSSFAEKSVDLFSTHVLRIGIGLWLGAVVILILFANGVMWGDPDAFTMIECWLIGLGCIGVPILPMRLFGRFLNPVVCVVASGCLFAGAAVFTVVVGTRMLPLSPMVSTFALIIPEALAIHAANAAIVLVREQRLRREVHRDLVGKYAARTAQLKADHQADRIRLEEKHAAEIGALQRKLRLDVEAAYAAAAIKIMERSTGEHGQTVQALLAGPRSAIEEACAALHAELVARDALDLPSAGASGASLRLVTDEDDERQDRASGH